MAAAVLLDPRDVSTTLNYYTPLGDPSEEAYRYIYLTPPPGRLEHNLGEDPHPVVVHDARGREAEFSLDVHGFQFLPHESAETDFVDEERIKGVYYKEAEELLKNATGAKRVVIFDHTIRLVLLVVHGRANGRKLTTGLHLQTPQGEGYDGPPRCRTRPRGKPCILQFPSSIAR